MFMHLPSRSVSHFIYFMHIFTHSHVDRGIKLLLMAPDPQYLILKEIVYPGVGDRRVVIILS